jgi:hypothetical protein
MFYDLSPYKILFAYKIYIYGHYPSYFYLKHLLVYISKQRFGDWILSPSSGKTYSLGPNR